MSAPSNRTLSRWWSALPEAEYQCSDCGHRGPKWYVQPQHPAFAGGRDGTALCADCISRRNEQAREARRVQLATAPRCEVPECGRRATFTHNGIGVCGAHLSRARAELARRNSGAGWLAMFSAPLRLERAQLVELATAGKR